MTRSADGGTGPDTEFWSGLTGEERSALRAAGRVRRWDRREIVFHEGSAPDFVLVVLTGRVKVSSHTEDGTEALLAVRGPGALLGELGVVDERPRSATVQTLEDMTGLVLGMEQFTGYLEEYPRTALILLRTVVGRLRDADRKRVEFGSMGAARRVAARLVELADRFGNQSAEGLRVALPVSQDELASWTGVSRAAVNKAMGVLRSHGWVTTGRLNITVHDMAALRRYAREGGA
ncbi:Crp/Fnr family transcriptional regulator [Nocardiopsis metallicus]|uniref:CRP-like cAMP-binding protein n=1 Tax=Nocardiopsis metallicus TaxID=179819 RepID=A0A840WFD5_9ACTN|nr:Crp/Fnr family transcriptional regulator [Nocardiopsis metallicus]MBB5490665.1 CRP-like cAMP-binding protein [Nocardiopsis metallicus]